MQKEYGRASSPRIDEALIGLWEGDYAICRPGAGRGPILLVTMCNENWTPAFAGATVLS